jgi:hypothetical protein
MSDFDDLYGTRYLSASEVTKPVTATIDRIDEEDFARPGEAPRVKKVLYVRGGKKGIVLNKTNANNLASAFGRTFPAWIGQRMIIRAEPTMFAGKPTMGLRLYSADGVAQPQLAHQPHSTSQPTPQPTSLPPSEFNDEIPW